jgi:hypothetical protein
MCRTSLVLFGLEPEVGEFALALGLGPGLGRQLVCTRAQRRNVRHAAAVAVGSDMPATPFPDPAAFLSEYDACRSLVERRRLADRYGMSLPHLYNWYARLRPLG